MSNASNTSPVEQPNADASIEKQDAPDHSDGVMIAFFVAPDVAAKLALPGGEAPEQLHCTLAYFGKAAELGADFPAKAAAAIEPVAAKWAAIEGVIGGAGLFNASESSDGKRVLYASPDCPGLVEFRQEVLAAVEAATGARAKRTHGYTPHVTLAYVDEAPQSLEVESLALRFDEVALAIAGHAESIPLSGSYIEKRRQHLTVSDDGGWSARVEVTKRDEAQKRVFGFAMEATNAAGAEVTDHGADVISEEEMAETAFDWAANSGRSGVMHKPEDPGHIPEAGYMIASVPLTQDMRRAMEIEPGPGRWFVGIQLTSDEAWRRVQSGELREFSIKGTTLREALA